MFKNLLLKEIQNQLTSFRFLLTMTLTLVLVIISTFVFVEIFQKRMEEYRENENANRQAIGEFASNLSTLAHERQTVPLTPTPLELISEGGIKVMPNTFRLNAFRIEEPESISAQNPFMRKFTDVDWTFTIAFILSFFAILLTYDAISGEKADGTLCLTLSHPVSRSLLILGKYISAIITIAVPVFLGTLISLFIAMLYGQILFSTTQIIKIILFVFAALTYLSIFILAGLLITSLTKHSITSILFLLFVWVFFAILLPSSGGKIASKFLSIPTQEEIQRQIENRREEISNAHQARNPHCFAWNGNIWADFVPARAAAVNDMADARNAILHEYMLQKINQVRKAKSVLKVSPTTVFASLSEQICTTGLNRFEHVYMQIRDYRDAFHHFIIEQDRSDPGSPHCVYEWESQPMSQESVDFTSIPRFQEMELPLTTTIRKALVNFSILIVFNAILFIAVFIAFQRYDVR